jgi:hypothetical protein
MSRLAELVARGFDFSTAIPFKTAWHVRCSQCEALCINGVATHETGCPNATHECRGCNEILPMRVEWCEDCR